MVLNLLDPLQQVTWSESVLPDEAGLFAVFSELAWYFKANFTHLCSHHILYIHHTYTRHIHTLT